MRKRAEKKEAVTNDNLTNHILEGLEAYSRKGGQLEDYIGEEAAGVMEKMIRTIPTVTETDGGVTKGYDIFSLLLKHRVVILDGQVEETMASIARAMLLFLDKQDKKEPIGIIVDSPGGSVLAGLSIYDTVMNLEAPIKVQGNGIQMSMGSIFLVMGNGIEGCENAMTSNAWLMLHGSSGGFKGKHEAQLISTDFTNRLNEQMVEIYVRHTGLTHEFWDTVLREDTFLSPEQAKEMGFIQKVKPKSTTKKTLHEAFAKRAARPHHMNRNVEFPDDPKEIALMLSKKEYSAVRPELVVALSKFPEFWTPSRKAMMEATNKKKSKAPANAANDDRKPSAPGQNGPR